MARSRSEPLDRAALTNYALKTLTGHAMSAAELRARLARRAADPADVDPVLTKLHEGGLLDDRKFAESYAASRLENQGFGRSRVLSDLRRRRVASQAASEAVNVTFEGTEETALIERFLERKYRGKNLAQFLGEDKNLAAAYRRLRVAGFTAGASIRTLKRYAARADELEETEVEDPESGADFAG